MDIIRQKDFPANYSEAVIEVLSALSLTGLKSTQVVGSASLRSQQYAGDYDADEKVKVSSPESMVEKLREMVKRVRTLAYFTDIKCGEVTEWNVFRKNAGVVDEKVVNFNIAESQSKVDELEKAQVLSRKEAEEFRSLLSKASSVNGFLEARKTIRHHILRWTPADILEGAMVYRNQVIKLEDAIVSGGMIKADVIANIQDRFVELSIIYDVFINGKRVTEPPPNFVQSVTEDIIYYEKTNPFKALKRVFALARHFKSTKALEKLLPILNSDLGRLYQIIGDMGTIAELLERPSVPMRSIETAIAEFKARLGTIYSLKDILQKEHTLLGELNAILKMSQKSRMKERMERMKDTLQGILNRETLKQVSSARKLVRFG